MSDDYQPEEVLAEDTVPRIRVGMFSESFYPVQNGVTTSLLTLTAELRRRHHNVLTFAPAHHDHDVVDTNVLRFPSFVSMFNRDYPLAYPIIPGIAMASYFRDLHLDVVHTHTPFVLGLAGAQAAIHTGIPLVSTFHTLYTRYSHYMPLLPDNVTQHMIERYLPWYYNRCDAIICPSQTAADELKALGVSGCVHIIPTGIPMPDEVSISDERRMQTRSSMGVGANTPMLVYAGRLAREKRLDWLIQAFRTVQQTIPNAVLFIAGTGPTDVELREECLPLGENVRLLGHVAHDKLAALLTAADLFCFPSPSETQGLVIGEARACGTPAVVMNSGGAPETVTHGEDGICIDAGDVDKYAAEVVRLLKSPTTLAQMRRSARQNAHNFTPESMAKRVMDVYRSTLAVKAVAGCAVRQTNVSSTSIPEDESVSVCG